MKSIKCRVWSGNMWYDGNDALRFLCAKNPDSTDIELTYLQQDYDINLYTGLTDKLGAPIYEGDILEWPASGEVQKVYFNNGMFLVGDGHSVSIYTEYVEVIGNIYETPELLK